MAVDLSLIPQNRVAELVSKLSSIDSSISTINTNITTNNNNAVHKTGNETVAGNKIFSGTTTFTNDIFVSKSGNFGALNIKNTGYDYLTNPSAVQYQHIVWKDKNNKDMSYVQQQVNTDGTVALHHIASNYKTDGTRVSCAIGCYVNRDGGIWTAAPTPATSDNSTKIATTAFVKSILSTLYPVGSTYITTASTCPLATLISGSTWTKVSEGRVLWGSDSNHSAGSTIEPGLPNITGKWWTQWNKQVKGFHGLTAEGAFYDSYSETSSRPGRITAEDSSNAGTKGYPWFDASRSNPIYGASTTVQPPAYVVNIFQRTA